MAFVCGFLPHLFLGCNLRGIVSESFVTLGFNKKKEFWCKLGFHMLRIRTLCN
jgi:hypothetical protein